MRVTRGVAANSHSTHSGVVGSAVTIGNFDGVHVGHQAILTRLRERARVLGLSDCVLTFEPHPRELFSPAAAPTRLTSLREKLELLRGFGVERTHVIHFLRAFAAMSADEFVRRVLIGTLNARCILVGGDFRFGAKRSGDIGLLKSIAIGGAFVVESMDDVRIGSARVASSAVREALAGGNLDEARMLLGRSYSISGRVIHGDKLGRQLGFATANIRLKHNRPPFTGIFAVRLHGEGPGFERGPRDGVASLGVRPTVKAAGAAPILEVHLFDFSGELYGRHVGVEFLRKIRDEEKFPDVETLKARIAADCDAARAILMGRTLTDRTENV